MLVRINRMCFDVQSNQISGQHFFVVTAVLEDAEGRECNGPDLWAPFGSTLILVRPGHAAECLCPGFKKYRRCCHAAVLRLAQQRMKEEQGNLTSALYETFFERIKETSEN